MSATIPKLTYLQLSYLLTQLIYDRAKSPQNGFSLFHKAWQMINDCVCYQNPHDRSKINDREVKKNTHIKSKGQCKDKCLKNNSYIFLHNSDSKTPYINIYIDLPSINFNLLSVLSHYAYHQISDFEIHTSPTTILQLNAFFFLR